MKFLKYFSAILLFALLLNSCGKDDIDTEKPSIDISIEDAFPISCATMYFDEPFVVKMRFSDNVELGAYSIDIHNNFDQHTHSTEADICTFDTIKTPVNPFVFIEDYSIPSTSTEYETDLSLTFPSSDGTEMYDEGDYHFFISLTDKEGWSTQKGLSVKILHR